MGGGDHYLSAKRSNPMQWGMQYAVGMQNTVGTQYTVGVSAKRFNSHSGLSKYGWWGPLPLVQKGQNPHSWAHSRYVVCSRC